MCAHAREQTCPECKQRGTTIGSPEKGCNPSYHLLCAFKAGFGFTGTDGWKFYCKDHLHVPGARNVMRGATSLKTWTSICDTSVRQCKQWARARARVCVCDVGLVHVRVRRRTACVRVRVCGRAGDGRLRGVLAVG